MKLTKEHATILLELAVKNHDSTRTQISNLKVWGVARYILIPLENRLKDLSYIITELNNFILER